jgi:hypothetical protein
MANIQSHTKIYKKSIDPFKLKPRITKAAEKVIAKNNKKYIMLREPIGCRAIIPIDDRFDSDPTTLNWVYCQKETHKFSSYCQHHSMLFQYDLDSIKKNSDMTKLLKIIK